MLSMIYTTVWIETRFPTQVETKVMMNETFENILSENQFQIILKLWIT